MPYIAVTTSKALSDEQKDELKKTIGQKISLIPGKTEAALMVDISDNHTMYFAGEKRKLRTLMFAATVRPSSRTRRR